MQKKEEEEEGETEARFVRRSWYDKSCVVYNLKQRTNHQVVVVGVSDLTKSTGFIFPKLDYVTKTGGKEEEEEEEEKKKKTKKKKKKKKKKKH